MKTVKEIFTQCKMRLLQYRKHFLILLVIYLSAFCSIFRANFAYWDDVGRTYAGYHGWLDWSRYCTEILATFVHASWHLTDISPFPQILACVVMAVGGIILMDIFKGEGQAGIDSVPAAALTALTPFFLGMISYKFDSPYMAFSFLVSVFPFLYRKNAIKVYAPISILSLLLMCTTYQASSGIYPMVAVFLVMQDILSGKRIKDGIQFLGISALCYLSALSLFWLALMRDNGVSVLSVTELIPSAIKRYLAYYEIIYHDFAIIWLILIVAIVLLFLYSACKTAEINKIYALLMGVLIILIGSFLCFGAFLFISRDSYDARTMYGFNVFLALMAIFIAFHTKHWVFKLVYMALTWCFFVFSLTYGNALSLQQDYMQYRTEILASDLNSLETMNSDDVKRISIVGDIGYSPAIRNMAEDYPILNREDMIPVGLGEGLWNSYYFYHYLNIPNIEEDTDGSQDENLPVIKDTMYHTLKGSGNRIVIELK